MEPPPQLPPLSLCLSEASSPALQQLCRGCPPHLLPTPTATSCKLLISLNDGPAPTIQSAYTCYHALRPSDRSRPSPTGPEISYRCFEFSTWTGFTESRAGQKHPARELQIGTYLKRGKKNARCNGRGGGLTWERRAINHAPLHKGGT